MGKTMKDLNRLLDITIIAMLLMIISIYSENSKAVYTISNNLAAVVSKGSTSEKIIALSFDDGPHPEYTNQILDLLKQYNIKATFFVLGIHAESFPHIIQREVAEGHEIGNHSYSHVNMRKSSKKTIKEEFEKTQEKIYSITNIRSKLFRPPYGNYSYEVIEVVANNDSSLVLWTFYQDSKDWSNPGVDVIVNTTLSKIQKGDIILFHDYIYKPESNTVEALKEIIPKLIEEGYEFVTISELINLPKERQTLTNFN